MERFVIIDGNAILHRAFHAMPPLTTSSGEMVNAVYGFASILLKVRDDLSPSYMAVTFDLPAPTFRKKLFKDYQVQRPVMDKDLSSQVEKVKEMVRTLGIPIYEKEGFEADDVIGTLAEQTKDERLKTKDLETIIVTGDRDILQLVNEKTKVYMPVKGLSETVLYDSTKVKEKFGLPPDLIPDYKGLVGDQSDNYPGVAGIGPKTAVSLLQKYGSFENLFQCFKTLEQEQPKVVEKLEAGKEGGELSYKLATIVRDAPVELNLEACKIGTFDKPEVRELFERLEFRSLIKRLGKSTTGVKSTTSTTSTTGKGAKNGRKHGRSSYAKATEDKSQMSLF